MKSRIRFFAPVLAVLLLAACKDQNEAKPDLIDPSDAQKVGAALVMPSGTQSKTGTPPAPSQSPQAPRVSATVSELPTTNGGAENISVPYNNLNGGLGGAYAQVEGASSYFDIPVQGNAPSSGVITLPVGLPENLNSGSFVLVYCIYDRSGRVSNVLRVRFTISRVEPPQPGEGRVTIGGRTYDATAICEIDLGGYGKAYGILIGQTQFVALYHLKRGSNQLNDVVNGTYDPFDGIPWAGYFDGSNFYFSTSGTASYNGRSVSMSARMEDAFSNRQISLSAAGNCE
jgi:hypothetical protein